ncbi:hypothetical protein MKEN_01159600 [Mycena kentingensis (nom. inval.)]|nr:hypothetical protein MKEN_01159600 [Mycena kentingensis (nom. inval.)]
MSELLPPELEHRIFTLAASSRPASIPRLCLVAWRVQEWTEPLLYRTLVVNQKHVIEELPSISLAQLEHILRSKPPDFINNNVHNLYYRRVSDDKGRASAVIAACKNLRNLFFLCSIGAPAPEAHGFPPLRHLYCHLKYFFVDGTIVAMGMLATLTHLELFTGFPDDETFAADSAHRDLVLTLGSLPSLTHLAVDWEMSTTGLKHLLAIPLSETKIRTVVVLCISYSSSEDILAELQCAELDSDPRVVLMPLVHYGRDWQYGALFGEDYWAYAEEEAVGPSGDREFVRIRWSVVQRGSTNGQRSGVKS